MSDSNHENHPTPDPENHPLIDPLNPPVIVNPTLNQTIVDNDTIITNQQ